MEPGERFLGPADEHPFDPRVNRRGPVRAELGRRLSRSFEIAGEARGVMRLPALGPGASGLSALSGGERDPYLSAYLVVCYALGKPLFSDVVAEMLGLEERGIAPPEPALAIGGAGGGVEGGGNPNGTRPFADGYDYRQYRPLEAAEGRALADAALRFYSGGVEYTPWRVEGFGAAGDGSREVVSAGLLPAGGWVEPGVGESSLRPFNYTDGAWAFVNAGAGGEVRGALAPHAVGLSAGAGDAIAMELEPGPGQDEVRVEGLSLYTARNRAWSPGVVAEGRWSVSRAGGHVIAEGTTDALNDGTVSAGAAGGTAGATEVVEEPGLLHIPRGADRENEIRVGYDFAEAQRIDGVVLQLARSHESPHGAQWFREERPFAFEYRTAGGTWHELEVRTSEISYRGADGAESTDRLSGGSTFADQGESFPGFSIAGQRYAGGGNGEGRGERRRVGLCQGFQISHEVGAE